MPTINSLPTVTSSDLPNFNSFVAPVVVSNQTKKISMQTVRDAILPKVMLQAITGNVSEVVFNNPTSMTVNVYGQVTSVTPAGNQAPTKVDAVQPDREDFKGEGQVINSGVAVISHIDRHTSLPPEAWVLPPFKINKSGHVLSPVTTIVDQNLYLQRQIRAASIAPTGVGLPVTVPEKDISRELAMLQILAAGLPANYDATQLKGWFDALVLYARSFDAALVELMDRINRVAYAVRQLNIADTGGYTGAGDDTFVEHRSQFLGRYNFYPFSPGVTVSETTPNNSQKFFTVPFDDGVSSSALEGNFSTLLNFSLSATEYPSIAAGQTRDIWNDLRINATWVPAVVYNTTAQGGGYAGSVAAINVEYVFTKAKLATKIAQFNAGTPQGWTDNWQVGQSGSGNSAIRTIILATPTVAQLRTINANFATASNTTLPSNTSEYAKNTLLGYFTFSGRPNKYWIPVAGSNEVPNASAINSTTPVSISFGSTAQIPIQITQTPT